MFLRIFCQNVPNFVLPKRTVYILNINSNYYSNSIQHYCYVVASSPIRARYCNPPPGAQVSRQLYRGALTVACAEYALGREGGRLSGWTVAPSRAWTWR